MQLQTIVCQGRGAGGEEGISGSFKEMLAYAFSFNPRAKSGIQAGTYVKLDFMPKMIPGI